MKDYGVQRGANRPPEVEITSNSVFIASNVQPYEEEIEGYLIKGYSYDYVEYTKDEYIAKLGEDNKTLLQEVIDTQLALTDLYELVGGEEDGDY